MRSRLWTLILRELPFPFREIGTELLRLLTWIDRTAAGVWLKLVRTPAWFSVALSGTVAVGLTCLLFFSMVARHDPTLPQLIKAARATPATRETLERAGDWSAQDKWRLAHLFVDHRPPKRPAVRLIDSRLVDDFPAFARVPGLRGLERRVATGPRFRTPDPEPVSGIVVPETDVRLDLARPSLAEEPRRLVYRQLIRETGWAESRTIRGGYRTRDPRLLVQAEWMPGIDCYAEITPRPTRRIIPVPEPEWDEPLPLTDSGRPDLSLEMSMIREFLPPTADFPPRSRLETVSALSELPPINSSRQMEFGWDEAPWGRTRPRTTAERPEAYADRVGTDEPPPWDDLERDPRILTAPSFTEIALRMELMEPQQVTAGQLHRSAIVLRNLGIQEIPRVLIRESLTGLETVTDAVPAASVDQFDNILERRLQNVEPGKEQRLEVEWVPESAGRRTHTAIVTVRAAVGATTDVVPPVADQPMPSVAPEPLPEEEPFPEFEPAVPATPAIPEAPVIPEEPVSPEPEPRAEPEPEAPPANPAVAMDVNHAPKATVDEEVEFLITVRNTGDVDLNDLLVTARLPQQLRHRQGESVQSRIPRLAVGGTHQVALRVLAESQGRAVCKLDVAAAERVQADSRPVVDVVSKPAPPPAAPAVSRPVETPKVTQRAPAPRPRPAAPPVTPRPVCPPAPCYFPVAAFEDWYLP